MLTYHILWSLSVLSLFASPCFLLASLVLQSLGLSLAHLGRGREYAELWRQHHQAWGNPRTPPTVALPLASLPELGLRLARNRAASSRGGDGSPAGAGDGELVVVQASSRAARGTAAHDALLDELFASVDGISVAALDRETEAALAAAAAAGPGYDGVERSTAQAAALAELRRAQARDDALAAARARERFVSVDVSTGRVVAVFEAPPDSQQIHVPSGDAAYFNALRLASAAETAHQVRRFVKNKTNSFTPKIYLYLTVRTYFFPSLFFKLCFFSPCWSVPPGGVVGRDEHGRGRGR